MSYMIPLKTRIFRAILGPALRLVFRLLSRVKIVGRENIPTSGGYIIAFNHVSLFDPPLVISFWPTVPEAIGAVEIWSKPGQSTLAKLYGGIAVHRGQYDRESLAKATAALKAGRPLVIAPEGGRSHQPGMRRAQPGVAFLVEMCPVPVLPVGIIGTTEDFFQRALHGKRPQLTIHIGSPIMLPPITVKGEERRKARQENVDRLMFEVASLLPEEYRGVYAQPIPE